jgi:hypothetical protein
MNGAAGHDRPPPVVDVLRNSVWLLPIIHASATEMAEVRKKSVRFGVEFSPTAGPFARMIGHNLRRIGQLLSKWLGAATSIGHGYLPGNLSQIQSLL